MFSKFFNKKNLIIENEVNKNEKIKVNENEKVKEDIKKIIEKVKNKRIKEKEYIKENKENKIILESKNNSIIDVTGKNYKIQKNSFENKNEIIKEKENKKNKIILQSNNNSINGVTGINYKIQKNSFEDENINTEELSLNNNFQDYKRINYLNSIYKYYYKDKISFKDIDLSKKFKNKIKFYEYTEFYLMFKVKIDKYTKNNFLLFETSKLYIEAMQALTIYYTDKEKSFSEIIYDITEASIIEKYEYHEDEFYFKNIFQYELALLFYSIFNYIKNFVNIYLELTTNKNILNFQYELDNKTFKNFTNDILKVLENHINDLKKNITIPNDKIKFELLPLSDNLFKSNLKNLLLEYNNNVEVFLFRVHHFFNLSQLVKNRFIIYYEAAKFLSGARDILKYKLDNKEIIKSKTKNKIHFKLTQKEKEATISFYLHYIFYNKNYDYKKLPNYNMILLFENEDHINNYTEYSKNFNDLLIHKNLNHFKSLLNDIPNLFLNKRKKINIENLSVEQTEKKHSETLNLLNCFLNDEEPKKNLTIIKNQSEVCNKKKELFKINFSSIQLEILDLFCINEFKLTNIELDNFAKKNNIFKNQFIDSINEKAFEILDDNLIEFDENFLSFK